MKKVFLSLYLFMAALNSPISAAVNDSIGSKINLQFVLPYTDPRNPYGHAPVRAPQASIDDHTLYLWDACDFLVYIKEEEGDVLPVITNFTDFRSARYLATVDKEYGSEFTVVAYNQNGHRRSESLSVPAIQPASINMRNLGTYLNVTYGHKNKIVKNMTYIIQNIPSLSLSTGPVVKGTSSNGQINIQGLLNGLNLIKIQLPNGRTSSIIIKK